MENKIISTIYSRDNKNIPLNKERISSINDNSKIDLNDSSNISQDEPKNNNLVKMKELLNKLLKQTLDQRLTLSEKNTKIHFMKIKATYDLTKTITKLTINMGKQIQEKLKKDKEKQSKLKSNRYGGRKRDSPHKSTVSNTRTNFYRAKTPSHINKFGNNMRAKTPIMGLKRDLIKSKSNMGIIKNSRTIDANRNVRRVNAKNKTLGNKTKSSINVKNYNPNDSNLDDLQTISVTSIKTNKTNTTTLNTISNSRTNNKYALYKNGNKMKKLNTDLTLKHNLEKTKVTKMLGQKNTSNFNLSEKNLINLNTKKNNPINNNNLTIEDKRKRKKTPFNKKKNNDNESVKLNTSSNNKRNEKSIEDEIDDILSMECNLQKETGLNNDDPLLILPLKDLDFVPKGLLRRNSTRNSYNRNNEKQYFISTFNIINNFEKIKFNPYIFKYLSLNDFFVIKNISKKFHEITISYMIKYLENEINNIQKIKDNLNIKEVPNREGLENIVLSKGSKKATQLLNESQLNHLFKDEKIPLGDIILIYRIYFQMINHPFALIAKTDIESFWEKCKFYFTNEQNGKTGDILITMINKKKIDISKNNLYKIYYLVKGNLNKIVPNYFSSICGTTGLFVFIIKDILEFLGISQKIKKKENAFWTYSDIIEAINERINHLKNYIV